MKAIPILFAVVTLLFSCNRDKSASEVLVSSDTIVNTSPSDFHKKDSVPKVQVNVKTLGFTVDILSRKSACGLSEIIKNKSVTRYIAAYSYRIVRDSISSDNCLLQLLDSIVIGYDRRGEIGELVALDSLCSVSDGFLSEYFWEIGASLIHNSFEGYFDYIFTNRNSCLITIFVESISVEINGSLDRLEKKKEIDQFLDLHIKTMNMNAEQKRFLTELRSQINPNILD